MTVSTDKVVIGISFGTVYSCVSIPGKNGLSPEVIANEDGDRQIPSYVAYNEHEELCGTQAKSQALANPKATITHFRQLLGHTIGHSALEEHQQMFKIPIVEKEKKVCFQVEYRKEDLDEPFVGFHSVVDVTSKYLAKLKDTAEYFLSGKVDGCVISIPAHFEEKQKKALVKACKDAGFQFAYPVHEPVAACLAFNASVLKENAKQDKDILVLDLGAESFNISLVSSHDGLYTIEDSVEELNLGGISFDQALFEYAKADFEKKTKLDISDNKRSIAKLMNACERTKRSLSRQDTAPCSVESLYEGMDYNGTVLRGRFEMLSEGLLSRCKDAVLKCLKKNGIAIDSLDQVLLVGGSSRIPSFQKAMKSLFPKVDTTTEFRTEVEPDEAITIGCAVQASLLNNDFNIDFPSSVIEADHVGKSIGVKAADGKFHPIIPKGIPLPVRREFSLPLPLSQTSVFLEICELEKDGHMESLAEVALSGIPATVKSGKIEVVFLIEADHLMSVSITEKESGESVHAVLH